MENDRFKDPRHYERPPEHENLLKELERQADGEINVDHLVKLYKRAHPGDAIWSLIHDINRQALIWHNVIEVLKRTDKPAREALRKHYEETLKILPEKSLSNPNWLFDIDRAFEKMKNYSKALVKLARSYSLELLAELNVEVGTTASVQVALALPPNLTIGFEKSFSASVAVGATATRT